jgi:hypothetical protein
MTMTLTEKQKFRLALLAASVLVIAAVGLATFSLWRPVFTHQPPPFNFSYFEYLPEKERVTAMKEYLRDHSSAKVNAHELARELEQAGAKCEYKKPDYNVNDHMSSPNNPGERYLCSYVPKWFFVPMTTKWVIVLYADKDKTINTQVWRGSVNTKIDGTFLVFLN